LITAKDTCSQSYEVLEDLATQIPSNTAIRISLPSVPGCMSVLSSRMASVLSLFPNTVVTYRDDFNPFSAWLLDAEHVTTPYTMLMHNDVYFLDGYGAVKMYETMRDVKASHKVVVPMIYEREGNVSLSPHAVHDDLHVDATTGGVEEEGGWPLLGHMMDLRKGLIRWPDQMSSGAQTHFLEDHAFMVQTSYIPSLIDPASAFTMEYIDMYLNMLHSTGTKPYFEPESRIEFRVRHDDLSLGDIPYMAGRRSEINALGNHRYLEKKWKARFFFTSAWNYIKFATMRDTHSYSVDTSVPDFVEDKKCFKGLLFFTWFEFIGMNHYDGSRLWMDSTFSSDLCSTLSSGPRNVTISRRVRPEPSITVPPHWEGRDSASLLPHKVTSQRPFYIKPRMEHKMYPVLVLSLSYSPGEVPPDVCGLVVRSSSTGSCACHVFVPPFEYDRAGSWAVRAIEYGLSLIKTASRSSIYYAMRNRMQDLEAVAARVTSLAAEAGRTVDAHFCGGVLMSEDYDGASCDWTVRFDGDDELVKWSGKLHSVKSIVEQITR